MSKIKAVFLDRDGVINEYPGDLKFVTKWEDFHFLSGVKEALKKITDSVYKVFIISNQSGVSTGAYSKQALDLITGNMLSELAKYKIEVAGVYYCTHKPEDNCACRKPKVGLVEIAIAELKEQGLEIDSSASFFIGDTVRDIETGSSVGLKTILVFSGKEKPENENNWQIRPDFIARDLSEAADIIK
jgi:D-glycero-D-manno-heptose 1,7-bisphosphate phosphatase